MAEAQHFYQAIGELLATLVVADDGTKFLHTGSEQYPVFIPLKVEKKYHNKYQGQKVYWRVYPKAAAQGLVFEVVTIVVEPLFGAGMFQLQGDWIDSDQLQIWRNATADKVNAHNWRWRRLPISWSDAPAPDEAFWQLKAQLVDSAFTVVEAAGPFAHPPRLEKRPEHQQKLPSRRPKQLHPDERIAQPQQQTQAKQQAVTNTETIDWEGITPVSGKLELTIKFNTLPQVQKVNGQCHFKLDCEGRVFQVSVKQKQWSKIETANASYPQWVAALVGSLGAATADGFVLESPNIQVFERKSKQPEQSKESNATAPGQAAAAERSLVTSEPEDATQTAKTPHSKTQAVEATTPEAGAQPKELSSPLARPSTPNSESKLKKPRK